MKRLRFDKFGKYLFLFFILQSQFSIKGSNAGNTQNSKTPQKGSKEAVIEAHQQRQQQLAQEVRHLNEDNEIIEVVNFEEHANVELKKEEGKTITSFKEQVEHKEPQQKIEIEIPKHVGRHVQLVEPKPRQLVDIYLTQSSDKSLDKSPESDTSVYSMIRLSLPLRPKTHSRQSSHGVSSGEHTPGFDYDWVDSNSETSFHSALAHKLDLHPHDDGKEDSVTFEELCDYLESNANTPMSEEEMLTFCRRILRSDNSARVYNIPFYIKNFERNENAIKIHDILFAYLSQSGDLMSRCSSTTSHSTLETPNNSPVPRYQSPDNFQMSPISTNPSVIGTENIPVIEIVEGIPKEHLIHSHQHQHHNLHTVEFNNYLMRTRLGLIPHLPSSRVGYRTLHPIFGFTARMSLDPVREERSMSEVTEIAKTDTNDIEDGPIIEEID